MLIDENTEDSKIINKIKLPIKSSIKSFNKANIYKTPDPMPGPVESDKAKVKKKAIKISPSQEGMPTMARGRSKKKTALVNKLVLSAKILEWKESIQKLKLLTLLSLAKQDFELYINLDIWFRSVKNLKAYCLSIMQQQ